MNFTLRMGKKEHPLGARRHTELQKETEFIRKRAEFRRQLFGSDDDEDEDWMPKPQRKTFMSVVHLPTNDMYWRQD